MQRFIAILLIVSAICVGVILFNQKNTAPSVKENLPNYPKKTALIGNEKFTLLVTRTPKERQLGLGAVPKLPKNYGMIFDANGQMEIWMKGMKYPIDILWIDKNSEVIHVVHDAQPSSYPKTTHFNPPNTDARTVMELNAGETKRLNISLGTKITIE